MSFVVGIITMIRLTKNMPKRLTDATLYSTPDYCVDTIVKSHAQHPQKSPAPEVSSVDHMSIIKCVAEVEEKMSILSMKSMAMLAEKEEMMNAATNRANALEQELAANRKVTICISVQFCYCPQLGPTLQILKYHLHWNFVLCRLWRRLLYDRENWWPTSRRRRKRSL